MIIAGNKVEQLYRQDEVGSAAFHLHSSLLPTTSY